MLVPCVVEDAVNERVVVTIYKTSQCRKYLRGIVP